MCTAATYKTADFYFGRTLDYEFSYGDEVTVTPRNYPLTFRHASAVSTHYAIIGMAHVAGDYPLYYDAFNEKGLCMAGLNFVGNASYQKPQEDHDNIAQFEFIPWILSQCASVKEARVRLAQMVLTDTPFNEQFAPAQLHWILADKNECIVIEPMADGLHIYDNPVGVLTNNPPFPQQLFSLNNYMNLSPKQPQNTFSADLPPTTYSRGMGALGLPGDLSSASRFARVAFTKSNARSGASELESVSQFFHILGSVDQQRGCCEVSDGKYEITLYTSCCNADKGIYYYTTYENHQITAVDMNRENLDGETLSRFPLVQGEQIRWENGTKHFLLSSSSRMAGSPPYEDSGHVPIKQKAGEKYSANISSPVQAERPTSINRIYVFILCRLCFFYLQDLNLHSFLFIIMIGSCDCHPFIL